MVKAAMTRRPERISGSTTRLETGHGPVFVTVNGSPPLEVFVAGGKSGACAAGHREAIGRLISLSLQVGVDPQEVCDQLLDVSCCPVWVNGVQVKSDPDAVARILQAEINSASR